VGLQGGILTAVLNPPIIPLTSVVVSADPHTTHHHQRLALERAVSGRVNTCLKFLYDQQQINSSMMSWKPQIPTVHIVSQVYDSGKSIMSSRESSKCDGMPKSVLSGQKRKHNPVGVVDESSNKQLDKSKATSPCGVALNWNQIDNEIEVLVGARGICQGKKPKSLDDYLKLASRLSQATMVSNISADLITKSFQQQEDISTESAKRTYQHLKKSNCFPEWSIIKTRLLTLEGSPLRGWLRSSDDFEIPKPET
jgi:hypothetical protein